MMMMMNITNGIKIRQSEQDTVIKNCNRPHF